MKGNPEIFILGRCVKTIVPQLIVMSEKDME